MTHDRPTDDSSPLRDSLVFLTAFVLTMLDAGATYAWVETGVAIEGNPLLAGMMETTGTATTLGLRVVVGGALLLALRGLVPLARIARPALHGAALVLGAVGLWHLQGFAAVLSV